MLILKSGRRVISPDWDESPIDRSRARRSDRWRRLLAGRSLAQNMKPGCCCGGPPVPCLPCTLPASDLTLSWSNTTFGCVAGSTPLIYTPTGGPTSPVWISALGPHDCCSPASGTNQVSVSCDGFHISIVWWGGISQLCNFNASWTVHSCSPLDIEATTGGSFSNSCGNCQVSVNSATYRLTA